MCDSILDVKMLRFKDLLQRQVASKTGHYFDRDKNTTPDQGLLFTVQWNRRNTKGSVFYSSV